MSKRANSESSEAPQVAATNPATVVLGAEPPAAVPVAPGVGPEVAQSASGGVMPDLTLLKLEELLKLDPTDDSGPAGRSFETEPLQASPEDGELPADLTSLDLDLLLELDLGGAELPTLFEVAGLTGENQGGEGEQNGPPEGVDPPTNPLLDDESDDDGEPGSEDDPGFEFSLNNDAPPPDAPAPGLPAQGSSNSNGPVNTGNAGNSGQGSGAGVDVASNNNAGGNSDNVGGGSVNSNAGANPGNDGGASANSNAGSNPGNAGGRNSNTNAGTNAGSGAGAIAVAAAGIAFPGGGDLPASITPADVASAAAPGQSVPTPAPATVPAGPPATVPPAHSAATYVPSSTSQDGPGNSSFGHNNGPANGNNSPLDNPSSFDVPPAVDIASDVGSSNAPPTSTTGTTVSGSGAGDLLTGTAGDDVLTGKGGNDTLNGGAGDDTLSGGGGSDVLDGEAGADDLSGGGGADILVWDFNDINIDGGGGADTLRVDSGDADITVFGGNITSIEIVDLATDTGANTLTLTAQDVLDMSGTDTLTVSGDALDSLDAGTGWTDGGVSGGNHTYTQVIGPDTATLVVDTDLAVNANILV